MRTINSPSGGSSPGAVQSERWTPRMVIVTLLLALTLEAVALGAIMIAVALPSILEEFPTDQGGWVSSAYFLAGAVAAPLLGKCADLYGKKRILLVTMAISGIGTLICVFAPSFGILIVGRAFQGVILATLSLTYSLIRDIFPPKPAAFAASLTVTGMGFFGTVTPILVGWLLLAFGWRGMFLFDVLWTFGMLALVWIFVPESTLRKRARPDVLGAFLLAFGVAGMLIYVSLGRSYGWGSVLALSFLIGGAILFVAALIRSKRVEEPIIKVGLFTRRAVIFAAVLGGVGYAMSATIGQLIPLLALTTREDGVTYGLGLTTVQYAQIETPKMLMSALAGFLLGWLVARGRSPRMFMVIGMALWATSAVLLATMNDTQLLLTIGALIAGVAGGLVNASLPNVVIQASPAGDQASVAGSVQLVQTGLGAVAPVVMFSLMAPYIGPSSTGGIVYGQEGFNIWLYGTAGLIVLLLILAGTVLRPRPGEVQTLEQQQAAKTALQAAEPTPVVERD